MSEQGRRLDQPRDDDLLQVTVAPTEIEAEMLAEQLRRNGVEPLVRIEDDLRAATRAVGGLRWAYPIYVLASDAERARAVLAAVGHGVPAHAVPFRLRELIIGSLVVIGLTLLIVVLLVTRGL